MTLARKILSFHKNLVLPDGLPESVQVMNPFSEQLTYSLAEQFYLKYYNDNQPRTIILGINPGRFGGGITGVPFTDPVKLREYCGIENNLPQKTELSADFIYRVIFALGGPDVFYSRFYINSVFPLGFTKDGKNLNYYDIPALQKLVEPYCAWSIRAQLSFGLEKKLAYCLGEGQNFKFLDNLNIRHQLVDKVLALPHPRFIMQYKRKNLNDYVSLYVDRLNGKL